MHPFPSVSDIIQSIPASAACFAKLEATHNYFQLPLDEEASRLTTFILRSGCYRYLRALMGLSSSSDEWCRHSDHVVERFLGIERLSTIFSSGLPLPLNWSTLFTLFFNAVRNCTLPCLIDTKLKFTGCVVSQEGVQPDPNCVASLVNFPVPTDQTNVCSFLGLCNQLAFFVPDYEHQTVSLRQLTGKGCTFLWLHKHQVMFDKLKINPY